MIGEVKVADVCDVVATVDEDVVEACVAEGLGEPVELPGSGKMVPK